MEGSDYIASRDQAEAMVRGAMARKPKQFILLIGDDEADEARLVLFAKPEFVITCMSMLTNALMTNEPTVDPPE